MDGSRYNSEGVLNIVMKELEIIIGKDRLKSYYETNNINGVNDELDKYLSKKEHDELNNIIEKNIKNESSFEEMIKDEKKAEEILVNLSKNMNQENLADILYNINENESRFRTSC